MTLSGARFAVCTLFLAVSSGSGCSTAELSRQEQTARTTVDHATTASLLDLPLRFEPNRGQMDQAVRFLARGPGYGLYLTTEGATFALQRSASREAVVSMHLVGGRRDVEPIGSEVKPGRSNYFVGNDPSRWRTGVEGYGRVRYPGVLPGVDVVYYGTGQRRLEYDLALAPRVDPSSVRIAFDGSTSITLDDHGAAVLTLHEGGEILQPAPIAYQIGADGRRQPIDVRYQRRDGGLGFFVGPYDRDRALVIDPTLVYSTYLGGTAGDDATCIAVDGAGDALVAGVTQSTDFPVALPQQGANAGGQDAFVTKFDGTSIVFSTYLGGSSDDNATGIAVDNAGEAFVVGLTQSTNFPVALPLQGVSAGGMEAFVTKLSATGALVYSTYLGGSSDDLAYGVAVDGAGEAFVVGGTSSTNFPTASPLQANSAGAQDAFITKLNATGSALVYSTYLGGTGVDWAKHVALDSSGRAFVAGNTLSTNFPTAAPFHGASAGKQDAFVTKLNAAGSALVYSTYLGGSDNDVASGIAVDAAGEAFVAGYTVSMNFPTASPLQGANAGSNDGFVTKLSAAGSALVYSTYLGGTLIDEPFDIAIDSAGEAFVAGYTSSSNYPTASPLQGVNGGGQDAFVTKLNSAGNGLVYSTYLGGSSDDNANGIAVDSAGEALVAGVTQSTNFPTASPFQANNAGGGDAFITKISGPAASLVPALSGRMLGLLALLLLVIGAVPGRHPRGVIPPRRPRSTA